MCPIVFIFKVELADRFMDILGQVFKRKEWRMWEIDVDRIVIHPWYDENGMKINIQNMMFILNSTVYEGVSKSS